MLSSDDSVPTESPKSSTTQISPESSGDSFSNPTNQNASMVAGSTTVRISASTRPTRGV